MCPYCFQGIPFINNAHIYCTSRLKDNKDNNNEKIEYEFVHTSTVDKVNPSNSLLISPLYINESLKSEIRVVSFTGQTNHGKTTYIQSLASVIQFEYANAFPRKTGRVLYTPMHTNNIDAHPFFKPCKTLWHEGILPEGTQPGLRPESLILEFQIIKQLNIFSNLFNEIISNNNDNIMLITRKYGFVMIFLFHMRKRQRMCFLLLIQLLMITN